MSNEPDVAAAARQLSLSLAVLRDSVTGYARQKLDALGGSVEMERRRRLRVVASAVALAVLSGFALLFTGVAVIAAFWDTHRVIAAVSVAGGFLVLSAVAGWALWANRRRQPTAFDWLAQLVALFAEYRRLRR